MSQKKEDTVLIHSHVFVKPAQHICSGLLDAGLVCLVDVLSLAVDKPMSLTRKDLHLVIHLAFLLQLRFKRAHLRGKVIQTQVFCSYMANVGF